MRFNCATYLGRVIRYRGNICAVLQKLMSVGALPLVEYVGSSDDPAFRCDVLFTPIALQGRGKLIVNTSLLFSTVVRDAAKNQDTFTVVVVIYDVPPRWSTQVCELH